MFEGDERMNLADLKRTLKVGTKLRLVERYGKPLNSLREVEKVQSNSIKMKALDETKAGWLEYPKASLLEFDGKEIKIYTSGTRELNEEEQKIRDNEPKDEEQDRIDMLSDGSTMFYRRKKYYKDVGYEYLFHSKQKGKRLTYADKKPMIQDDSIKGKLVLKYEVV